MMKKKITLKEAFKNKTKLSLGRRIYSGNGELYNIVGRPSKVVKIFDPDVPLKKVSKVFRYLKRKNNSSVAKIYECGSFSYTSNYSDNITQYYYVMDKLKPLPKLKNSSYYYDHPMVDDIRGVLEDDGCVCRLAPKVKRFCTEALKLQYRHCDIHSGNIMQNKRGALKFVDLESFTYDF